jgi:uncharacterized protein (TIGR02466 family)
MDRVLMKRLELFPTSFFEFKNPNINNVELVQHFQKYSDRMKHGNIISSLHLLHNKPEFLELFDWINSCLEEIRIEEKYDCENFKITNSWFNIALAESNMAIHYHRHSMSFFSGVYYLTEGAPTFFEDPVLHRTQAQIEVLRSEYAPTEKIFPEPGKLVIFPSWMFHYAAPHVDNFDRYIISFNSLPSGAINYNLATDSVLDISINSREKI